MIWPLIRGALYAGLGAAELAVDLYDGAKRIGRRLLPRRREDAFPLSHKDVERIAEFGRHAGHERKRSAAPDHHATIRPPPPDARGSDRDR
jgi:hypothetical protein